MTILLPAVTGTAGAIDGLAAGDEPEPEPEPAIIEGRLLASKAGDIAARDARLEEAEDVDEAGAPNPARK